MGWGYSDFILLEDLHNSSNGYIVRDTLTVEAEFLTMSHTKVFSETTTKTPMKH